MRCIVLYLSVVLLMIPLMGSGCANTTGIPDPVLRQDAVNIADDLMTVYEFSEDSEVASTWLNLADEHLTHLITNSDDLTENDQDKVDRIRAGIGELRELVSDPAQAAYLRQRSKSLAVLCASIGLFDNTDLLNTVEELTENTPGDGEPESPGDNPSRVD